VSSSTIRCLIIDDEPLAQNVIETYIQRVNYLTLVAKCENAIDAFDVVQQETIDLIFCDIQMPQITGIEFIKSLKNVPFVIFTTAFPEYAIEGFNLDAIDYLLKPVSFERFLRAIHKVKASVSHNLPGAKEESQARYLFVKEDYKLVKINHTDIFYIEGMKDYVKIFTPSKTIITHITMKRLEGLLPGDRFVRSHKSFIVRFDAIKAINGNTIELSNNSTVPIGLQYRDALMSLFNNIN
jgi:two-component system, LytTR family, response regulator